MSETVKHFNIRTGRHAFTAVPMPDGTTRAVWAEWDGPDFDGYFTAEPGGPERRTDEADMRSYNAARGVPWWYGTRV